MKRRLLTIAIFLAFRIEPVFLDDSFLKIKLVGLSVVAHWQPSNVEEYLRLAIV